MCPVSAPVQISSFRHYVPLDHHYIEDSCEFWLRNPKTRGVQRPTEKQIQKGMGRFRPRHFFSILTLRTLRQWLDWPLIWVSTSQPEHEAYSGPLKKISRNFTPHQFKRKPLIAEILERWLLVGKKVPYKFPNDIASKLSTLHGINQWFVCQPKNGKFFERP